jgi:hypothetical protein
MTSKNITIRVDRIVTTLNQELALKYNRKSIFLGWSHKMLPDNILGFKKLRNFRKPKDLFINIVKYEDDGGRKIMVISEPHRCYIPRLCIAFIPTIENHFNFKLIKKIYRCVSFKSSDFKLSTFEVAIDNQGQRKYANNFWIRSQRFGYSKGKKNWGIDYLKIIDNCEKYQKIIGARKHKQISSYKKEECGLTFERNELVMKRSFLRNIGVRSLKDLNCKQVINKICNSFNIYRFNKKEFESDYGKIDWMPNGSNNYDLKFIASELNAEHGQLTNDNKKKISKMPRGQKRKLEITKRKRIPNFKRQYLSELRINGTIRKGIKNLIQGFFQVL